MVVDLSKPPVDDEDWRKWLIHLDESPSNVAAALAELQDACDEEPEGEQRAAALAYGLLYDLIICAHSLMLRQRGVCTTL